MATTYTPIATTTLSSATTNFTFSSIPSTYTDLVLVVGSLTLASNGNGLVLRYNSDTASNYSYCDLSGTGSTSTMRRIATSTSCQVGWGPTGSQGGMTTIIVNIASYSNTSTYKMQLSRWNDPSSEVGISTGTWRSTSAISSIQVLSGVNMNVGTTLTLYGVKAA